MTLRQLKYVDQVAGIVCTCAVYELGVIDGAKPDPFDMREVDLIQYAPLEETGSMNTNLLLDGLLLLALTRRGAVV